MRFTRRPRITYAVTDRKRAAARRWQQRQRDAVPLLAQLVAEQQPAIEQVMNERVGRWACTEQRDRDRRAELWRRARRELDNYAHDARAALLSYWNRHRWLPGDPTYLLDALLGFENGRLILSDGSIRQAQIVISVSEAVDIGERTKPVARGWLG